MRDDEQYEPMPRVVFSKPILRKPSAKPARRQKVNKAAVVLGDPWVVFGGFLRVFSRRK